MHASSTSPSAARRATWSNAIKEQRLDLFSDRTSVATLRRQPAPARLPPSRRSSLTPQALAHVHPPGPSHRRNATAQAPQDRRPRHGLGAEAQGREHSTHLSPRYASVPSCGSCVSHRERDETLGLRVSWDFAQETGRLRRSQVRTLTEVGEIRLKRQSTMYGTGDAGGVLFNEFLDGSYDCVDRVVLRAYFQLGQPSAGVADVVGGAGRDRTRG